jgi:hypothetical protein
MPQRDPVLIGFMGPAGAGKSTAAGYLCDQHDFTVDAFAEPIRDMLTALLVSAGIDYAYLFEPGVKEQPIPGLGVSARQLMQTLGDWGRSIDPDFWVKHAAMRLGLHDLPNSAPIHDRIALSDVRFPNEAEWIKRMGGQVVAVDRDTAPVRDHASEQQFGLIEPDLRIDNTGDLFDLRLQLDEQLAPTFTA